MAYRRTDQVVRRLNARRKAILDAARVEAAQGGLNAVQIVPVARRANIASGTVYRYFPSKTELITELIVDVSRGELAAVRLAADAAPGPLSALAAAVTTIAVHVLEQRMLTWAVVAESIDVDVSAPRLQSRSDIVGELDVRIQAAMRAGHLPDQDTALSAAAMLGALHEGLVGPLARVQDHDPSRRRETVQALALFALRAVGVMDARARGLVVQTVLPARALAANHGASGNGALSVG